jgi:hypothetical protein
MATKNKLYYFLYKNIKLYSFPLENGECQCCQPPSPSTHAKTSVAVTICDHIFATSSLFN